MKCPNCGRVDKNSRVLDSRPYKHTVRRRRLCTICHHRWSTYEASEIEFTSDRNRNKYLPWSPGEEETLILMHHRGISKADIAKELARSRMSVSRKLDKLMADGDYLAVIQAEMQK